MRHKPLIAIHAPRTAAATDLSPLTRVTIDRVGPADHHTATDRSDLPNHGLKFFAKSPDCVHYVSSENQCAVNYLFLLERYADQ